MPTTPEERVKAVAWWYKEYIWAGSVDMPYMTYERIHSLLLYCARAAASDGDKEVAPNWVERANRSL